MCGINGIFTADKGANHQAKIELMCQAMPHRGPDNQGAWSNKNISLGHRRLSIIDLNARSNQPLTSNCGKYKIIYNGEVYNYKAIRKTLAYEFVTNSDSEVVLAAFIQHGHKCLDLLDGMFAFAIYNIQTDELFIARDKLGKKPLYYHYSKGLFIFSSEIRSIHATGLVKKDLNKAGVKAFFNYKTVYSPHTIFNAIKMLEAGHYLKIRIADNEIEINKACYWSLQSIKPATTDNLDTIKSKIKKLFIAAVEKRLIADVPVAAFLSGGVDSTAVVAGMKKISSNPVHSFNINFGEEKYSEAKYARWVAEKYNLDHHEINLSPDFFLKHLDEAIRAMDHPSEDGLNTFMVSKAVKEYGYKVVLSGLGGDELFGGYYTFDLLLKARQYKPLWLLPKGIRNTLATARKTINPSMVSDFLALALNSNKFDLKTLHSCLRNNFTPNEIKTLVNIAPATPTQTMQYGHSYFADISKLELSAYMSEILLRDSDQMSMANSIEIRAPFCDIDLIEYVLSLPEHILINNSHKKLLFDSLGEELIPSSIFNRPKMGFVLPTEYWLKNELFDWAKEKFINLSQREFCNTENMLQLWKKFESNQIPYYKIWPLVILEAYFENKNL